MSTNLSSMKFVIKDDFEARSKGKRYSLSWDANRFGYIGARRFRFVDLMIYLRLSYKN